ncbi:bifunctional 2-polyprenyl-6-hydroxyphenol methylase/3-demethylubiquinol 3-O-methyltransferase UbiG [Knoellia sp. p5-6-4]|uniref:class I SAM-dependent methyltransferase n=1 Tax=unclassified Knoellia TaxID=2618719 RepID=UPI0023D9B9F5|nr:class I SAM-dependent methyltransferase [Knoellia sp. p5-6-4]MDF2143866.1 class I SAM-dependent methyltransferase [Knoellia sp. p5-6-4]
MESQGGRGPQTWDERYAAAERVWSAGPNREVEAVAAGWPPGRALDLGAGEGRHALWLAERGWQVTAVDFSAVGIDRGRQEAARRSVDVEWVVADVTEWEPAPGTLFDLVLVAYLHIPQDAFSRLGQWLAPGGALVVVGHSLRNLTEGVGGPQDPSILHTTDQLRAASDGLEVQRCEEVLRPTDAGDAIDVVLVARRPAG